MLTQIRLDVSRESYIDPHDALLAPGMWKIPNFTLLTVFGLSIGFWYVSLFFTLFSASISQDTDSFSAVLGQQVL